MKICSASGNTGSADTLANDLASDLNTFLANPDFAGSDSWEIVWGPVVWQAPFSNVADQAMAVCYCAAQNLYVVPIAATNPHSSFDVFYEDLAVPPVYMQPVVSGGAGGNVSAGNSVGLQALLGMADGGVDLRSFLAGKANAGDTLVFCGHSLGGGLTPLLAYSLYPSGTASSGWKAVYTYPTAGPTTADATFAATFDAAYAKVAGASYQMWNANQYNTRDIVPNAWSGASTGPGLAQITSGWLSTTDAMFYTTLTFETEIVALRDMATALATASDGTNPYSPANNNPLFTGPRHEGQISSTGELANEVLFQHIQAYIDAFGVTALFTDGSVQRAIQPPLLNLVQGLSGVRAAAVPQTESA